MEDWLVVDESGGQKPVVSSDGYILTFGVVSACQCDCSIAPGSCPPGLPSLGSSASGEREWPVAVRLGGWPDDGEILTLHTNSTVPCDTYLATTKRVTRQVQRLADILSSLDITQ